MKERDVKVSSTIKTDDGIMAKVIVENVIIEFSLQGVNEKSRAWLIGILENRFAELYATGYNKALSDIREVMKTYLKVCGIEGDFKI